MPEHYTRNTLECTAWCGPCIDPKHPVRAMTKAQEQRRQDEERRRQNPGLFE